VSPGCRWVVYCDANVEQCAVLDMASGGKAMGRVRVRFLPSLSGSPTKTRRRHHRTPPAATFPTSPLIRLGPLTTTSRGYPGYVKLGFLRHYLYRPREGFRGCSHLPDVTTDQAWAFIVGIKESRRPFRSTSRVPLTPHISTSRRLSEPNMRSCYPVTVLTRKTTLVSQ
jgi:hypothetical protein